MDDKYVVWGTGKYATRMMEEIKKYEDDFPIICKCIFDRILCFVDSDIEKKDKIFYNKPIKSPDDINWDKCEYYCVVAIADSSEVVRFLDNHMVFKTHIMSEADFICLFHRELLQKGKNYNNFIINGKFFLIAEYLLKWRESNESLLRCYNYVRNKYHSAVYEFMNVLYFTFYNRFEFIADRWKQDCHLLKKQSKIKTIGLVVPIYGGGGAERVVSHLLALYHDMGYKVVLITRKRQIDGEYEIPEEIVRVELQHLFDESMGECFKQLEITIKEHQIDLLFIHLPYEGYRLFYVTLLAKLLGIYVIVENHTSFINLIRQRGGIISNEKIYKLLDCMIVLSKVDYKFWSNLGCRCRYIPNPCIDLLHTTDSSEYDKQNNTILWIGRLDNKYKRFFDIIPIMSDVARRIPDVRVFVVGRMIKKSEYIRFKEKIKESNLEDTIILCGGQENVKQFYCSADVMLMTSPGEGFPMVMAEAMSCGLPIVMYDLPYLELVKNGRGLAIVPQGDIHQAAEKIVDILQNKEKLEKMSREVRESIEPYLQYDLKSEWENVFNDISLGKPSPILYDEDNAMIERLLSDIV